MNKTISPLFVALLAMAPLAAMAQVHGGNAPRPEGATDAKASVRCGVLDTNAFDRFIATKPTPVEFRARLSCIQLVMPDSVTTMEMRADNSRYFPQLDQYGRIVGGSFR
ncbi:hypothetical protein [Luteibacter sp. ME-Dv--P-043b]|uniref:hypothetical protein n=1 Tax=Luteibacter sp. ME-Dv--P-043b TaxID=3040291 RepID=UPI0025533BE1|nr:hypothetical protein [Luteibacter sp. ME-Dv--P-043b]